MKITLWRILPLFLMGVCLFVSSARADTLYTYTGSSLNAFFGGYACPPECQITGSFTVANSIPSFSGAATFTSWSFTDGNTIWNNINSSVSKSIVVTDSSGNIIDWQIAFAEGSLTLLTVGPGAAPGGDSSLTPTSFALNFVPGSWSPPQPTSAVPEPTSLSLLAVGLLGVVVALGPKRLAHPACTNIGEDFVGP